MDVLIDFAKNSFPILLFVAFAGYVLWSMFSKAGKGRLLGGEIVDSSREEIVQKAGILTTTIRTHVVKSKSNDKLVGIEISENAKLGASFKPIKLTKPEAQKLVRMLTEVIGKT